MIKASELRVGNWITCKGKLLQIDYHHIRLAVIQKTVSGKAPNYDPIPLTPELLEQCGGYKTKDTPFYEIDLGNNVGQLHVNPNNGIVWIRHHRLEGFGLNPMTGNPYYLHQLQNLYFALSGKELEINSAPQDPS